MEEHVEKPLVQVRNLTKVFVTEKAETHALSDVTFDVGRESASWSKAHRVALYGVDMMLHRVLRSEPA